MPEAPTIDAGERLIIEDCGSENRAVPAGSYDHVAPGGRESNTAVIAGQAVTVSGG